MMWGICDWCSGAPVGAVGDLLVQRGTSRLSGGPIGVVGDLSL